MHFLRSAPQTIPGFEGFQVVKGDSAITWVIYRERGRVLSRTHALMIGAEGVTSAGRDGRLAERLGAELRQVNILSLFASDGSDDWLLPYYKPKLAAISRRDRC
jgi:hypothetical protein